MNSIEPRRLSQPPGMLSQLIELVNCLPQPFLFRLEDSRPWLDTDGSEKADWKWDFSRAEKPIEARLLHPEVIWAEVAGLYPQFDLEYALKIDPDFASEFETEFLALAGHFAFRRSGKQMFSHFVQKQPKQVRRQMVKNLAKLYQGNIKRLRRGVTYAHFDTRRVIFSRIERFGLSPLLTAYLRCEIFPPLPMARVWLGPADTFNRWYDIWDAAYKLWGSCGLAETTTKYTFDTDSRPAHFYWSGTMVDADGILRTAKNLFDRVVESAEIEARRIKECRVTKNNKVCGRVFWAARKDQKTCSTECSNLFHVHRYRHKTCAEKGDEKLRRITLERRKEQ